MELKRTTIQIPKDILIKIKSMAVKEGKTQNNIINELITKGIENKEKIKTQNRVNETAIERIERLTRGKAKIANKDTYNPDESNSIKGIIETPEKDFDIVKAVHDASCGKCE